MDIIALAADHRGFAAKSELIAFLKEGGFGVLDLGTHSDVRVDSQDYAIATAKALKEGKAAKGIIICGSGNGIAMAANRFSHVRAAVCPHVTAAKMARQHNDANVISLAADYMGVGLMKECVEVFVKTEFLGGRYGERVQKLTKLDPNKC
jgi:ribose 5-phosphate isomerase B